MSDTVQVHWSCGICGRKEHVKGNYEYKRDKISVQQPSSMVDTRTEFVTNFDEDNLP